jgi:Zn finger protein HypA/HybF involved in hydrogenase expression
MEYRKYSEVCRRCGEVFETDELFQEVVCEKCQYDDWHEAESEMEETHA